jgi:7-carboxy-7-deazaguanine synthase
MFGNNSVVGKKFFENAEDKLFITSVFFTLQGEGPYRGMPALFVRFAKCNLQCNFCDTFFDDGEWLSLEEIDNKIEKCISDYFNGDVPLWAECLNINYPREIILVITGGEPMLQKNIVPFIKYFENKFRKVQIESNGLINQHIPFDTCLVVSPKASEISGHYLKPSDQILNRANVYKFVMSATLEPYTKIPEWALKMKSKKDIFVSPMNIYNRKPVKNEIVSYWTPDLLNMEENQKNHEYTAKYCLDNGLIFNMQLHLFASMA